MCSLAVGSVNCSACVNRRCLRCTIWAAALRTASSWRCAAASMGLSVCLVRCRCRACVTAPLMVASLIRGSRRGVRWPGVRGCGLAILRVVAGFPPGTSPLACPCLYGGGLRGGVVARATGVFFGDVDVFAGEPSCDPGEEW